MAEREYTDRELFRMQQDAVERVQDMQSRSNQAMGINTGRFNPPPGYITPNFKNWSTDTGVPRKNKRVQQQQRQERELPPAAAQGNPIPGIEIPDMEQQPYPIPPPAPAAQAAQQERPGFSAGGGGGFGQAPPPPPGPTMPPPADGEKTTVLQDILGGIGLDDDRMLIIGLLFILINAKADTTLILALMYLLI